MILDGKPLLRGCHSGPVPAGLAGSVLVGPAGPVTVGLVGPVGLVLVGLNIVGTGWGWYIAFGSISYQTNESKK